MAASLTLYQSHRVNRFTREQQLRVSVRHNTDQLRESYLRGSEIAEPGVGTLDRRLLHDAVARLAVTHVVRAQAVLSVEQAPAQPRKNTRV